MQKLVLTRLFFCLYFLSSTAGICQSNFNEVLEKILNSKPCALKDNADYLLKSFRGRNINDSLDINKLIGIQVFRCDPKASNKYFKRTLDLALKTNLYDTVYREIFVFRSISEDQELLKKELTYFYDYLNKVYVNNPNLKKNEYYYWLCKELINKEITLKNYVSAKQISESLIIDLEKSNDYRNLIAVEDLLISIYLAQSHFNEAIKHINMFIKICDENFSNLDDENINDLYFKRIMKLECRLSLSDTLSNIDFYDIENYFNKQKEESQIQLTYIDFLKIRNALNKFEFSKNTDYLIGVDKLFKRIEKEGILDLITEEEYYPFKYIYSVYSNNHSIDEKKTTLNPLINLAYNIQKKEYFQADSIISQIVKNAMNLNKFNGFSSEEILLSRNSLSGLIINSLGNYFLAHKNVKLLSDLYSNYSGYHLELNKNIRKKNELLSKIFSEELNNTAVDYSKIKKVYCKAIDSIQVLGDQFVYGLSDSICKSLNEDEVFIQWVYVPYKFDLKSFTSAEAPFYIQLSYFKNGTVNYHILENGAQVHDVIDYWKNQIINQNDLDENIISVIAKPFLLELNNYKKVIICPSGRLVEIPFESIPISGDFLISTKKIQVINSAKSLLDMKKNVNNIKSAKGKLVFVGSESYKTSISTTFANLPGVKKEKELLQSISARNNMNSDFYFNDGYEESNVKRIENPYILHIAAHGIIFSDSSIVMNQNLLRQTESVSSENFYSGIVFSNAKNQSPLIKNDQVLNEQEFSLLDLRKTYLVTLSSCFSGNGQETLGDGVMGFRKAIAETGAKYTLVANWAIDDQISAEFMSQFYKCLLELKMDVETAFRSAQLELKSQYKYPVYWASFTLIEN